MLPALVQSGSLSGDERDYLRRFMQRCIERTEGIGDRPGAATAHYNLGNYLRGSRHFRLAFHHYRKAAEYDPGYLDRKYFWRELAGILFESRRYRMAVQFYERAINLGEEGECRALYADALMFVGKYRKSQEAFDAYLSSASDADPEWCLKAWALRGLRSMLGCDEQKRQMVAAIKLVPSDINLVPDEAKQKLKEALRHDALCGLAWFNLGVLEYQTGNRDDAFISFLMAALIQRNDVEAWCNSIALGIFSKENESLVLHVIHIRLSD
jgi:tetratricopeptide (TPR) repeat protein